MYPSSDKIVFCSFPLPSRCPFAYGASFPPGSPSPANFSPPHRSTPRVRFLLSHTLPFPFLSFRAFPPPLSKLLTPSLALPFPEHSWPPSSVVPCCCWPRRAEPYFFASPSFSDIFQACFPSPTRFGVPLPRFRTPSSFFTSALTFFTPPCSLQPPPRYHVAFPFRTIAFQKAFVSISLPPAFSPASLPPPLHSFIP